MSKRKSLAIGQYFSEDSYDAIKDENPVDITSFDLANANLGYDIISASNLGADTYRTQQRALAALNPGKFLEDSIKSEAKINENTVAALNQIMKDLRAQRVPDTVIRREAKRILPVIYSFARLSKGHDLIYPQDDDPLIDVHSHPQITASK